VGGLALSDLLRPRAAARPAARRDTALLVVWLHGGASHLETYDPKPLAPSEYRGPFKPIATRVPGLQLCELLPRHARVAHRFTLLRSLAHTGPCHDSGPQQLFTGFPIKVNRLRPDHPDLFAVVDRLRAIPSRSIPNNVGVPPIPYLGAAPHPSGGPAPPTSRSQSTATPTTRASPSPTSPSASATSASA
jgi:hypothetical protein